MVSTSPKDEGFSPATSTAVSPGIQPAPLRRMSEMDEESLLAVAETVTRVWRTAQVATTISLVGPLVVFPPLCLLGLVPAAIADELARRAIRDDVRALGFDAMAERSIIRAWRDAQRAWKVKLTSRQKHETFLKAARSARAKARLADHKAAHRRR